MLPKKWKACVIVIDNDNAQWYRMKQSILTNIYDYDTTLIDSARSFSNRALEITKASNIDTKELSEKLGQTRIKDLNNAMGLNEKIFTVTFTLNF